ncbi:hypothetical protein [Streptomyces sp. NPDC002855]|uniref:DUF7677 family protein n=1 Tax=Streptomyces sp. NPDC002855 TaxID=3154437 RepID=UPI00331A6389
MEHLSADLRASLRLFAFYLANGTIDVELLDEVDYRSTVFHSGSSLEQVFAIYGNVLRVDVDAMVLNDGDAQYRVAQWIRACCDPSYRVEPPFEAWETELHFEGRALPPPESVRDALGRARTTSSATRATTSPNYVATHPHPGRNRAAPFTDDALPLA